MSVDAPLKNKCWVDYDYPLATATRAIRIRAARSIADLRLVLQLRHRGYRCFPSTAATLDDLDLADNTIILLAEHQQEGAVGTLRLSDGAGPVELDQFVVLESIENLKDRSFVEATRFTLKRCRDFEAVKIMLCKAHWLYALRLRKQFLLMSSKPAFAEFYQYMRFVDVGPKGQYQHSALRMALHNTYYLHAPTALRHYQASANKYYALMADPTHAISFE